MPHFYTAYGLSISSCIPISEFLESDKKPEVRIVFGKVNHLPKDMAQNRNGFYATKDKIQFCFKNTGRFSIQKGKRIVIDPLKGIDKTTLRPYIRGPMLAILLLQRGFLLLHASTVQIGNACVSFLGGSGWGKSTIAASFNANGYKVLSEDISAINIKNKIPKVIPSFPLIKLSLDISGTFKKLKRNYKPNEKFSYKTNGRFPRTPLMLKRIYLLEDGNREEIIKLKPKDALIKLMSHAYGINLIHTLKASWCFSKCANLANTVPVCILKRRRKLEILPKLIEIVERDLNDN